MKLSTLDLLRCPECGGDLALRGEPAAEILEEATLVCAGCARLYPVRGGIPSFVEPEDARIPDHRFARFYDWFSRFYGPLMKIGFLGFGGERKARREVLDRLELKRGRLLEVSVGTGSNLPYLFESPNIGEVYGLDISPGQLKQCRKLIARRGWPVELFLGTAEALPFRDESFDSVLHIGGINFFSEKKRAIEEMIRVAKPGTRIVIADESEQIARNLSRIPGFGRGPDGKKMDVTLPVHLVPDTMEDIGVTGIWKAHGEHHGYCLDFRKPA